MKNDYGTYIGDQEAEFQRLRREKEDRAIAWICGIIAIVMVCIRWWMA